MHRIVCIIAYFSLNLSLLKAIRFDFDKLEYRFNPKMINVSATVNEKKILNVDYVVVEKVDRLHVCFELLNIRCLESP